MKLEQITTKAINKKYFVDLNNYISFCKEYLEYISKNLQATIISQNENQYHFFQYNQEGGFQITRPINSNLMYDVHKFHKYADDFTRILMNIKDISSDDQTTRKIINNTTYTIQQSIGAALDGLPVGKSNTARKLNGDLFEHFIRLIIDAIGIKCKSGVIQVPVILEGETTFKMKYQHDLIIGEERDIKVIGSIKTSSKDRIDKIFIDKFLYNKLTDKSTPHIAIFLNDIQRKKTKTEGKYGVSATFLPGHFKGYTVKLNPLDGVYYCDIRPNMTKADVLKDHIKTFDCLLVEDIWKFV